MNLRKTGGISFLFLAALVCIGCVVISLMDISLAMSGRPAIVNTVLLFPVSLAVIVALILMGKHFLFPTKRGGE